MIFNSSSSEEEIRSITFDIVRKETTNQSATLRLNTRRISAGLLVSSTPQRSSFIFLSGTLRQVSSLFVSEVPGVLPNMGKTGS